MKVDMTLAVERTTYEVEKEPEEVRLQTMNRPLTVASLAKDRK